MIIFTVAHFDVENGVFGMMRNVLLRLCELMGDKPQNIRALIGMSNDFHRFIKHSYFFSVRKTYIRHKIIPYANTATIVFDGKNAKTVFVDTQMFKGCFRWTVQIENGQIKNQSILCLGVGVPTDDFNLRLGVKAGSFSLDLIYDEEKKGHVLARFPESGALNSPLVSLELDTHTRTLCFFVGNAKLPRFVSNVPLPTHFGASGSGSSSFESICLRRLPSPTQSAVVCEPSRLFSLAGALMASPEVAHLDMTEDYATELLEYFEDEMDRVRCGINYILGI